MLLFKLRIFEKKDRQVILPVIYHSCTKCESVSGGFQTEFVFSIHKFYLGESEMDRLGGMLYCRLVGPARFMEWVMIDGLRKSNLDQC